MAVQIESGGSNLLARGAAARAAGDAFPQWRLTGIGSWVVYVTRVVHLGPLRASGRSVAALVAAAAGVRCGTSPASGVLGVPGATAYKI